MGASMRPGQQSPRKPCAKVHSYRQTPASMRPGQQSPRKPTRPGGCATPRPCFNEAGATIAPETRPTCGRRARPRRRFNEAGATIAPETWRRWRRSTRSARRFNEAGATIAPETAHMIVDARARTKASMRPGQQSPRKRPSRLPRPRRRACFNEAGATIAPETPCSAGTWPRPRKLQ